MNEGPLDAILHRLTKFGPSLKGAADAEALQMYSEVAEFVRRMTTIIEPIATLDEDSTTLQSRQ